MSSPTVQGQRIQRIWTKPGSREGQLAIHVHIYVRKAKHVFIGYYYPEQINIDIDSFVGMRIRDVVREMREKTMKFHLLNDLIQGN